MNPFLRFSTGWLISLMMAQQPAIIDFTVVARPPDSAPPSSGSPGIIAGKPEQIIAGITPVMVPLAPLAVVLRSITPSACMDREQVVYDVELTNTGTEPFLLPSSTSRESAVAGRTPEDYRKLTVVLMTETAKLGSVVIEPVSEAFGSELSPGTLQSLKPGEHVLLRAPAKCPTRSAVTPDQPNSADRLVQVFAQVGVWSKPNVHRQSLRTNTLDLKVVK